MCSLQSILSPMTENKSLNTIIKTDIYIKFENYQLNLTSKFKQEFLLNHPLKLLSHYLCMRTCQSAFDINVYLSEGA